MESGGGPIEIVGEAGLGEFGLEVTLCASKQELFDRLAVSLEGGRLETK